MPLGLLVFDPDSRRVVYVNDSLAEMLGLAELEEEAGLVSRLTFRCGDQVAESVWNIEEQIDTSLTVVFEGEEKGVFRVRTRTFEKNGRVGRQILLEPNF